MRPQTLLFILSIFLCASTVLSAPAKRGVPSGFVLVKLKDHMHAFEGAIKAQDKKRYAQLFNVGTNDEKTIEDSMNHWKGFHFKPIEAAFARGTINKIVGQYKIENPTGKPDKTVYPITLVRDPRSPTGWIIMTMG